MEYHDHYQTPIVAPISPSHPPHRLQCHLPTPQIPSDDSFILPLLSVPPTATPTPVPLSPDHPYSSWSGYRTFQSVTSSSSEAVARINPRRTRLRWRVGNGQGVKGRGRGERERSEGERERRERGRLEKEEERESEIGKNVGFKLRGGNEQRKDGTTALSRKVLVVFDFDWTMIECNSDTEVVFNFCSDKEVSKQRLQEAAAARSWTRAMDDELKAISELHVKLSDVEAFLASIPIEHELVHFVQVSAQQGVDLRILSDANSFFIEEVLRPKGILGSFSRIVTNPVTLEGDRIVVSPFHKDEHPGSSSSPPNLCKGRVVRDWVAEGGWDTIVYCGDGEGDYEGVMALPGEGVALVRRDWGLHHRLSRAEEEGVVIPRMILWENQRSLAAALFQILKA
eukprot:511170-Hanusia_phi.AAC.1